MTVAANDARWADEQVRQYEAATECINGLAAFHEAHVYAIRQQLLPDQVLLAEHEEALAELERLRSSLSATDAEAVNAALAELGPALQALVEDGRA